MVAMVICAAAFSTGALAQQNQQGATQGTQSEPEVISRWAYDPLYADGWSARALYADTTVVGPTGNEIGSVENILFSMDGRLLGIVAEVGGFADLGDTHLYVPWEKVNLSDDFDRVTVPVTEETAEEYAFVNSTIWRESTGQVQRVGELALGPTMWKMTDIVNDYGYAAQGAGYGFIHDLIISRDGEIQAIVVNADPGYGGNYRALPYRDYTPTASPYYDLGYTADEIQGLEPFNYEQIEGGNVAMQQ